MELQGTLLGIGPPRLDPAAVIERIELGPGSWVDVSRGWLLGADTLFDQLIEEIPWRQGRRLMWGQMVDDPRLTWWPDRVRASGVTTAVATAAAAAAAASEPVDLEVLRAPLVERYGRTLGRPGCNLYRDGRDSVAFHGDRELRDLEDTLVAIITLGATRPFLVRADGGGPSIDLRPAAGDLLVMGGSTQRDFEHAVPKCRTAGPRISITFRTRTRATADRPG